MDWSRFSPNPVLTHPPPGDATTKAPSIAALNVLGLVINPKLNQAALAVTDGTYVGIRSLMRGSLLQKIGSGYYGTDYGDPAEESTGFSRVHTPQGVTPRGMGFGTSLYTGLCLGAYHQDMGWTAITMRIEAKGISSESEGRSHEADVWWNAASERGLTEETTSTKEEEEEGVELEVDADDLERIAQVEGSISYVRQQPVVDVTTTTEVTANIYEFDSAEEHHLIASAFSLDMEVPTTVSAEGQLRYLWNELRDPDKDDEFDTEALLALDVRGMDIEAVNLLTVLYARAGLSEADIDTLRWRWERNVDPGVPSPQLRLFNPSGPVGRGIEAVAAARRATGWQKLAALP